MSSEDLFYAIGEIDEKFILEANEKDKSKQEIIYVNN